MPALPQDIPYLKSQGYTDEEIANINPLPAPQQSGTQSALNTLKAHLGSYLGGSAAIPAGLAGGAAAGALTGAEAGSVVPVIGNIIGGIGGGLAGAYLGSKAQEAVQGTDAYNAAQQLAQQAAAEHPYISGAVDLTAGAFGSGGLPSGEGIGNVIGKLAGRQELTQAGKGALFQAALNPAIMTGQSLASGQGIPSIGELAAQAAGGALFSNTWVPGHGATDEAGHGEVTNHPENDGTIPAPENEPTTMWNAKNEDGTYKIRNSQTIGSAFKKQFILPYKDIKDEGQRIAQQDMNVTLSQLPIEQKRQMLHMKALGEIDAANAKAEGNNVGEDKDYQGGEMPNPNNENSIVAPVVRGPTTTADVLGRKPATTDTTQPATDVNQRLDDFKKAQAELVSQQHADTNVPKPTGENALRITKDQMLPSDISRPTNVPADVDPVKASLENYGQVEKSTQNEVQPKDDAELAEEQFLTKGAVRSAPQPVNSALSDYNRAKVLHLKLANPDTHINDKMAAWQELENIKAKYKGMIPPQVPEDKVLSPNGLQEHITNNRGTTSSVLHILANTPDHPLAPLAKRLFNAMDNTSRAVKWIYDPNGRYTRDGRSMYDPATDTVYIAQGQAGNARTVMEEAVHSMVTKKLPQFTKQGAAHLKELQDYLKNGKNENVKKIIQSYLDVAKHLGIHDALFVDKPLNSGLANQADKAHAQLGQEGNTGYAMGNLDEFIAQALKDHDFQRVLESIPSTDKRSVWQNIVDAVRELLGLDAKDGTMLNDVLRTSGELIKQERPEKTASEHFDNPNPNSPKSPPLPKDGHSLSPTDLKLPPDRYMGRFGLITRAVVDKIHDINTPTAHRLANAMQMALDKQTELKGQWKNKIVQAGHSLTQYDKQQLMKAFNAEMATRKPQMQMLTNNSQRQFYKVARQLLDASGKHRLAIGEPVLEANKYGKYVHRLLKQDPTYFPGMANQKVTDIYRNNTDHAKIAQLDKEFHDYNTKVLGLSDVASQERIDTYKAALQGSTSKSDISHQDIFNGNRKAQGTPLPPSFREQNPVRNLERYFDRAAIDSAHYEHMEKDPNVLASLGQQKDAWGNKVVPTTKVENLANNTAVKAGLNQWKAPHANPLERNEESIAGLTTAAFISGPALEVHKLVSNIVKSAALATNPVMLVRALSYGMSHIMSGYEHAVENGAVRLTSRSAMGMLNGSYSAAERMQSLAAAIRKISTLGDMTTKVGMGLVQAMNESIIPSKILRAQRGDISAIKFMRRLDPTFDPHKQYNEQEVQQLASRSANYIHGTGDIRSLPGWMLNDSEFSGFFSLAHWSIAQTNNFMKEVYEPATRGDIKPLMIGLFGSAIGGYMIQQLRADISGKKSSIPSITEIKASDRGIEGNHGLVAYNIMAALQYSGFGGLLSQVAKYPFDAAYKNNPQGATFPMDEVATDLAETLHNVQEAIANDPNVNYVDLVKAVLQHTLSTDFQLSRIAVNQGINNGFITGLPAEKKVLGDKMNQLRRFDMTEHLPYNDIDSASNPYMNIEQKKFKMNDNIPDAIHQLPQLIGNIIQTYHNNPDVMLSKFKALKQNDYATFPSMEDMPLSFMKYLSYLQKEEGTAAATAEFQDYMRHKVTNEIKSSVVP